MAFVRHAHHRKKKLSKSWRKPRGGDNKLRLGRKGHGRRVRIGYRSPDTIRGMVGDMRLQRIVQLQDIAQMNKKEEIALVDGRVGLKQKKSIVEKLLAEGIQIYNVKNPEELKCLSSY